MTYFETPNDRDAYVAGISVQEYEARLAREEADAEDLAAQGYPHLDPEDRPEVAEADVETVSAQDLEDLQRVLDWEEHSFTL